MKKNSPLLLAFLKKRRHILTQNQHKDDAMQHNGFYDQDAGWYWQNKKGQLYLCNARSEDVFATGIQVNEERQRRASLQATELSRLCLSFYRENQQFSWGGFTRWIGCKSGLKALRRVAAHSLRKNHS